MRRGILAAVVSVLLVGFADSRSVADAPPTPTPRPIGGLSFSDEVEVTVVNIDVFVRDGKGRPVPGLTAGDFKVTQDDAEMTITNFAELSEEVFQTIFPTRSTAPEAEPADTDDEIADRIRPIFIVLYIDNENIHPLERNRVLRRVREFVNESLRPPVQMMVMSYQRSLKTVQPFTDDPVAINAALRSVQTYTGGQVERDSTRSKLIEQMRDEEAADYGSSTSIDSKRDRIYQQVTAYAREEANNLAFTLSALRQTVEMLAGVDGRKSIVYVSSGLPMVPGLGLMHEYATSFHDSSVMVQRGNFDKTAEFRSLTASASGQEVTFYTIDSSGLEVRDGVEAEDRYGVDPTASSIGATNYQASLRYLAQRTGGQAIVNTNDVGPGLVKIRDDLFTYYSVGYVVPPSGQDRIHAVEVKLPGRSDLDLRYRSRFVERSLETKIQDTVLSSLILDIANNPMHLQLERGRAVPASSERWTVPIHISIPLRSVTLIEDRDNHVGRVVLFVGARDDEGHESDVQRQEHEIVVPSLQLEEAEKQRYGIDVQLLMREGRQRVVVGVMDQITRQASYEKLSLTVP